MGVVEREKGGLKMYKRYFDKPRPKHVGISNWTQAVVKLRTVFASKALHLGLTAFT